MNCQTHVEKLESGSVKKELILEVAVHRTELSVFFTTEMAVLRSEKAVVQPVVMGVDFGFVKMGDSIAVTETRIIGFLCGSVSDNEVMLSSMAVLDAGMDSCVEVQMRSLKICSVCISNGVPTVVAIVDDRVGIETATKTR